MDTIVQDLRYAVRTFLKSPGSTLLALCALTLGIGANTAIFSVVNAVLLKPLPYAEPDRLVVLWEANPAKNIREFYVSPPDYKDWLQSSRSFDALAAFRPHPAILTGGSSPERVDAASISPRLLELLGARPVLGRGFLSSEDRPGAAPVVLLSYGLWQRRFGGNRSILGNTLVVDGKSYSISGVTDPEFRLLDTPGDLWIPYSLDSTELKERGFHTLKVIGRLRAGVSMEQASQEMRGIARALEGQFPDTNSGWTVDVVRLSEQMEHGIRATLLLLLGAVACVLLIACSNVAILLLTRASGREKEIAIRAALGADHLRIARQMLTESLLLSMASGALGLLLAYAGIAALIALKPANIPRMNEIGIDWRVAAFTIGVCLFTGILFGMVPALGAMRFRINDLLRVAGRVSLASVKTRRTRSALVVAEVALSVALLIAAGLLIRSFAQLQSVKPGFRADHVLTMEVALPEARYRGLRVARFYERLLERLQRLPGVRWAAVTRNVPMSGGDPSLNFVIAHRPELPSSDQPRAKYRAISSDYFTVMGVPLLQGRFFTAADGPDAPPVVIINSVMARRFWPSEDPLGKRMRAGFDNSAWCTIVGVTGDVKHAGLDSETSAEMYYPYLQVPPELMNFVESSMTVVLRTSGAPASLTGAVRAQVRELDPDQPVFHVQTMEQVLDGSIAQPRFRTLLLAVFAGMALVLAIIGLYGVIAYSVNQRSSEMGLRAALGAGKMDLVRLVMGEGAKLAGAGVLIGVVLAYVFLRTLSKLLYGVHPGDPVTFAAVPVLLLAVALLAVYIPARKASQADPLIAMR